MNLIVSLIIGGIVGWLASLVMRTNAQMGIIANVAVGVVGGAIGSWLAAQLRVGGGALVAWIMAVAGAVVLIFLLRAIGVFK